jgi:hypothetical protein
MELYSGPNMVNEKYLKTKYLRSKNRDSTVYYTFFFSYYRPLKMKKKKRKRKGRAFSIVLAVCGTLEVF